MIGRGSPGEEHPDGTDRRKGGQGRVGGPGGPGVQGVSNPESHRSENQAARMLELEHLCHCGGHVRGGRVSLPCHSGLPLLVCQAASVASPSPEAEPVSMQTLHVQQTKDLGLVSGA